MVGSNTEILQIADAVAREKGIPRDSVIDAMEQGIQVAGRRKYGSLLNIRAEIDRKTGEVQLFREFVVVDENVEVEDEEELTETAKAQRSATQLTLEEAKHKKADAEIGDVISEPLPPIDLGRVAAQTAKQVIIQEVRDAEREKQYEDYKDRVGEIVNGTIKRIEYGNAVIDLGNTEALLARDQSIRSENLRQNDRIRAYILDVRKEKKGPQIFLSRTAPDFMAKLFKQEVPEIYDGIIEVKAVAREPGMRAKIAVLSNDSNIDPVGSCVGVRGARVQAVINELQGEKIDIIQWTADPASLVVNALAPAEVLKVVVDEENKRIQVAVPNDHLSLAIGRRGQNIRLASQLVGWGVDAMTEEDESKRRTEEFNQASKLFSEVLNVEEVIAQLLAIEGFTTMEEVAFVPVEDLAGIEGFDEDLAEALRERAREYLEQQETSKNEEWHDLGVEEALVNLPHMNNDLLVALGAKGIKTLDGLGDLATDEFKELFPDAKISNAQVDEIIMAARAHWFEDDQQKKGSEAEISDDKAKQSDAS